MFKTTSLTALWVLVLSAHADLASGQTPDAIRKSVGAIPDLRFSAKEVLSQPLFSLIVHDGIYAAAKGMPAFQGTLTREQVQQIRAYVVTQSRLEAGKR